MITLDKKILTYALNEKKILLQLQTRVSEDYFLPEIKPFYILVQKCFKKFNEIPTARILSEQGGKQWDEEKENLYREIIGLEYDAKEFPADLEQFKVRYNTQVLLKFGQNVFKDNWDGKSFKNLEEANTLLRKTLGSVGNIYSDHAFKEGDLSSTVPEAWNAYKEIRDNPDINRGVHLGLREFDRLTNGLQKSELMLVGGESSSGKSALCMQMALNAWRGNNVVPSTVYECENMTFDDSGVNTIFITIEMPFESLRRRIDCSLGGISLTNLRDGKLTEIEIEKFKAVLLFQKRYPKKFHIIDIPRGCTMSQIESKFIEKNIECPISLVVIDYISLMMPEKDEGIDHLNLGRIAEEMHEFCRQYQISVISPVQLNRPPKAIGSNETEAPDQNRIGRSLMLVQNANIVLSIRTRKDEYLKPDMQVYISKLRDGERGVFVLHKRLDRMQIYDDVPGWSPEAYNVLDGYKD